MSIHNASRFRAVPITKLIGTSIAIAAFAVVGALGFSPASASAAKSNPNSDTRTTAPAPTERDDKKVGAYFGSGQGYVKYYSPGDGSLDGYEPWEPNAVNPPAAVVSPRSQWAAGKACGLLGAVTAPDTSRSGMRLTTLAGLGIGHLGVTGYLERGANTTQYDYVVLFDPGNYNANKCDNRSVYNNGVSQAATYAKWLKQSKDNTLVVFAGQATRDPKNFKVVNGKKQYDQGLRREVFSKLTTAQKQQVIVCEYADMNNPTLAATFLPYMNKKLNNPTQCPQNPDRSGAKVNAWRP